MMRDMTERHPPARMTLPSVSYGPFRQIGALPWLMVAATMRVIAFFGGLIALPAVVIANIALLLAFVVVTWRMIEVTRGRTSLGDLGFSQQSRMARTVLLPVFGLLIAATIVAAASGLVEQPGDFMLGFDGIAFDQRTDHGRLWSAFVAALVLLMVLQVDEDAKPSLVRAMREFARRAAWLVPAVLVVAAASLLLHPVQSWFRFLIRDVWAGQGVPTNVKVLLSFSYVLIFATIRLWLTVAILVFALRRSYRARPDV
ncbi:MAG TPA: hypothetical protein VGN82_14735 [Bosea sp. (in: a-proteobacteria)]|jgi:hypothetical protein|uniref:hypothetical protein n=1 Tax=Bosea sp. (in: a-proteobacteria) TaxID=1871050 RepID=UPI002E11D1F4|nr:hypothetical protein [Bosea sp. (in: a-proteobacteria)]